MSAARPAAAPDGTGPPATDPSLRHLLGRLAVVEARARSAVAAFRSADSQPDDGFRGLYVSEGHVDTLLGSRRLLAPSPEADALAAGVEAAADAAAAAGARLRLRELAGTFHLDDVDLELLVVAAAPDLEARFEQVFGYLQDDVSLRRPGIGLALRLTGLDPLDPPARARLAPDGPLVDDGLVVVEDEPTPVLRRALRLPDVVLAYLQGLDALPPWFADLCAPALSLDGPGTDEVAAALRAGARLCYLRDPGAGGGGTAHAVGALAKLGMRALAVDLRQLAPDADVTAAARLALLVAELRGCGLVLGPAEVLVERAPDTMARLARSGWPVALHGGLSWEPSWTATPPYLVDLLPPRRTDRVRLWEQALAGSAGAEAGVADAVGHLTLTPYQVGRAAVVALERATAAGREVAHQDLEFGGRAQNSAALERLTRRIEPVARWDDLVLPDYHRRVLHDLVARVRHRDLVMGGWQVGGRTAKRRGVIALFGGPPGTGKTLAAEVVAAELGLDLYAVNLATVIDKYIGETEKNLERIFDAAHGINGILLFDEADALFGKRSDVGDARDRYANIEVAYLLQRLEAFDGIGILASNLRANLDEAFGRRLDAVLDFPMPDEATRARLWETCLGPRAPRGDDIDLAFCASAFELSGGDIRNIVVGAAFLAAAEERPIAMADLVRATHREYRKLGRMSVESEFGPYLTVATS